MMQVRFVAIALLLCGIPFAVQAESEALERLARYIEVDTTNPPGNETRGVAFLGEILAAAGIAYETAEPEAGRGSLWARLEGGDQPALILLHHIDVVQASPDAWDTDPLQAVIKDGELFGRGAIDTKSLGIMHLEAFLALHRSGRALNRDVIFLATADEEAGGQLGAGWLVEQRPEIFEGAGYLLNEAGLGITSSGKTRFQIEVAQKRPYWLRLVASGQPGHGSSPRATPAPARLVAALHRIQQAPFEPRVTAPVRAMFKGIAPYEDPAWQAALADIDAALDEAGFLERLQEDKPHLHALLRNTCAITMLSGSGKINVIPPTASAEIDCRILPEQDAGEFLAAITERIDDEQIRIESIMNFEPSASSADTALFRLLETVIGKHYPEAGVIASVQAGFTDSHFFRERGIVSYGFGPFVIPSAAISSVHGNNERIGIASFERGVEMMTEVVAAFATD
ncbi:MAG: M20/M25/M40 family metallo-hydrolase [Gammaproteobacteria bacterium]